MSNRIPRISTVKAQAPSTLTITWDDGHTASVELAGWIATGGEILKPLADPDLFRTAHLSDYSSAVAWGDDEDTVLAIDSLHLRLIADAQRKIDGAELGKWQADQFHQ